MRILVCTLLTSYLALFFTQKSVAQTASDYAIQLEAVVQTAPPKITLTWQKNLSSTSYTLLKKAKFSVGWSSLGSITDTFYIDAAVSNDSMYEYKVTSAGGPAVGNGHILAGINAPAIHKRGTIILVIDTLFRDSCVSEIKTLRNDLSADGWAVLSIYFNRSTPDSIIKKAIKQYYKTHSDLSAIFLLGHVAVPYSGEINPDAHSDHLGAWPADVYYGDMDGNWSDVTVNNSSASRAANKNIPGDGKWDQSTNPSSIELQVGRIDFANMPIFGKTEVALMKSYLYKSHKYKMDSLYVSRTGLIDDNFGAFSGEAFAANAWRNFPQLIGRNNIKTSDFMTTLNDSAYQWANGTGGGSYTSAGGIGTTGSLATTKQKGIFTILFGSYFGDWDNQNNFLRAPLCCSEPALSCFWAGRPNWFFHYMALGENLGLCTRQTQNNPGPYSPWGYAATGVHIALMGDLSLRTDYIKPPQNINISSSSKKGATINWLGSADAAVIGYYVYRADSIHGQYTKLSGLIAGTTFKDTVGKDGLHFYMVRPCKPTKTPSGTYYNLGLGIFDSATISFPTPLNIANSSTKKVDIICFPNPAHEILNIYAHVPLNNEHITINILDIKGQIVFSQTHAIKQEEITITQNLSTLASGNYLVQLIIDKEQVAIQKFIKN